MGFLEIHTINGWRDIEDVIIAKDTCTICADIVDAEGEGYLSIDPVLFLCRKCRTMPSEAGYKCQLAK